jgi:hypothetical protein
MRTVVAILAFAISLPAWGQTSSFQLHGFLTGREIRVDSQPSWSSGGFGRFDVGADTVNGRRTVNVDIAQLGFDWTPWSWLTLHADGLGRKEQSGTIGRRAGIVQAYLDLNLFTGKFRLRAGSFWLPTSRENVDPLWNSRYTITYSALNTWIGEEVRPLGVDLQLSPTDYLTLGGTAFRGNDTMGTELAARGWAFGNRLSVYNEHIAVAPPPETTRPIGHDLDGKNGYSERIRVQLPERALLQVAHIDNRATLVPQVYELTPWRTQFNVVGATVGVTSPTTLAAEWAHGSTEVGFTGGTYKMDFDTAYVLLSQKSGPSRWTARLDRFSTRSHIRTVDDASREHGRGITVAWLADVGKGVRAGLEYCRVTGDHPGAAAVGFDPRTGGTTITAELRYGF